MKTLKVQVTAEDIAKGAMCEAGSCPIALALIRAGADCVSVDDIDLGFHFDGESYNIPAPPAASAFVKAFDKGEPAEPFEFELVLEDDVEPIAVPPEAV